MGESHLLQEVFLKLKLLLILMPTVFLMYLLWTRAPAKRTKLPSPMTKAVSLRKKLRGWLMKRKSTRMKNRNSAKNALESYCFHMKSTVEDEKLKDKISADDKKTITDKCTDTISWLDSNQLAEQE